MKSRFKNLLLRISWLNQRFIIYLIFGFSLNMPIEGFYDEESVKWEIRRFSCSENQMRCVREIIETRDQNSEIQSIALHGDRNAQLRDVVTVMFQNTNLRDSFCVLLQRFDIQYTISSSLAISILENRSSKNDQWEIVFDILDEIGSLSVHLKIEIMQLLWHPLRHENNPHKSGYLCRGRFFRNLCR